MEGEKKRQREQKRQKSTPASSRIKQISFEAILEVAMVMDNSDHQGAEVAGTEESTEWQSYGQMGVESEPEWLPI